MYMDGWNTDAGRGSHKIYLSLIFFFAYSIVGF